jgi:hypothetical protein
MRRALVLLAVGALLAACSAGSSTPSPSDPYPLPTGPPHYFVNSPAAVGQPVHTVLIFLQVQPGDRIELLGADPIGSLDGASIRFLLLPQAIEANGDRVIGNQFEPFEGAVVTAATESPGPDNTVGIAAELTASRPGRYEITDVRLRYRLNGGPEQVGQGIDAVWTVCADGPAPATCPES